MLIEVKYEWSDESGEQSGTGNYECDSFYFSGNLLVLQRKGRLGITETFKAFQIGPFDQVSFEYK